jgi:hypothetical protein
MKLAILLLATLLLASCSERLEVANVPVEPETEWIIDQYILYGEVATNERRNREGW